MFFLRFAMFLCPGDVSPKVESRNSGQKNTSGTTRMVGGVRVNAIGRWLKAGVWQKPLELPTFEERRHA